MANAARHAADRRPVEVETADPLPAARSAVDAGDMGPFDFSEAPEGGRLDLGALQVPAIEGVDLRVQADADGVIQQVVLVHGDSALQLGVFAAPRSEGIWDEVRDEIRESFSNDGVTAEEQPGDYGTELYAHVRTPDGLTDIRFVGVDGPRWMVRGVYQGPVAVDADAAPPLVACMRGLVVNRGAEAKPVREPLMLRLPPEMTEAAAAAAPGDQSASGEAPVSSRQPSPRPRRS
jgi:Protein of unknown function (DUF3710)